MDHVLQGSSATKRILLVTGVGDCANATEEAFRTASETGAEIGLLQILTSDLYHYGHNDLIATRPSKKDFLLYIREQVLERGRAEAEALQRRAHAMGLAVEVYSVETEDAPSVIIAEARKGYDAIFIPRERKALFPLFKKQLASRLRRHLRNLVVEC